jgi:hypothetical protein
LLPGWNPLSWIGLFPILENSLSSEKALYTWGGHYGFGPVMVTSIAMVVSLKMLQRWKVTEGYLPTIITIFVFSSLVWGIESGSLPFSPVSPARQFQHPQAPEGTELYLISQLPLNSSVSAQSHLLPHLTHQDQLFLLPPSLPTVVGSEAQPEFERLQPQGGYPRFLVLDRQAQGEVAWYNLWFFDATKTLEWIDWLVKTGKYRIYSEKDSLLILERSSP